MLHAYIAQLKKSVEEDRAKRQAERDEKSRAEANVVRERLTPLHDRLTDCWRRSPLSCSARGCRWRHFKLR